jgi:PEP-CTERM motif
LSNPFVRAALLLAVSLCVGLLPASAQMNYTALDILGNTQRTAPEPSSLLLLGAGLMYAAATVRTRAKR